MTANGHRTAAPVPLLSVRDLRVLFPGRRASDTVTAVDGVSFDLEAGTTLGLVGESGSGKTTVGRAILRLVPIAGGSIRFDGEAIHDASPDRLRAFRRHAQLIFQDPGGSMNPRHRVEAIVGEPLLVHGLARGATLRDRVAALVERCGLPATTMSRYPHQLSGGQRQRVAIARALALDPKLVICDEPTSALDVSIQARIVNLLRDLQTERGLSYLFISHDLALVRHLAGRIAVMTSGRIVETGDARDVLASPEHPYTRRLLDAVPTIASRPEREPVA